MDPSGAIAALAVVTAAGSALCDLRTGHIPNRLTLGALAAAPVLWFAATAATAGPAAGLAALGASVAGAALCGLGPLVLFLRRGIGGGDVKLLAAIGALLGPRAGMDAEFFAFVIAALYVPGKLAWDGRLLVVVAALARRAFGVIARRARAAAPVPELAIRLRFGPAILVGTVAALTLGSPA
jgi:prepilin peptidase CpaA